MNVDLREHAIVEACEPENASKLDSVEGLETWARSELGSSPLCDQGFAALIEDVIRIVVSLRRRLDKATWLRLLRGGRIFKELNEVLPVAARLLQYVEALDVKEGQELTIIDLASGIGYLSILLSELLRASRKIARFVLVDDRWPMLNAETKPHHINPMHLQSGTWAFELSYRKYDLKSGSGQRQLQNHVVSQASGPVAVLGVHLCGVLSLHAVNFFNQHPRCTFLALKPCCLPPMDWAKQKYVWRLGDVSIEAVDVCAPGKYKKSKWTGPQRKAEQRATFQRWALNLLDAIHVGDAGHKELADITLVRVAENEEARYQTLFAFAERPYDSSAGEVCTIHEPVAVGVHEPLEVDGTVKDPDK
eukprot:TRINITY_DN23280_c0_g1_i1.p1 TRINITY_DN23280_c0_g1~~TRINITY_DN23280_c0_g1_i1.p1  ORF type:complete len:362 (+),score=52.66 TRINITY_DN23280_c0_g1_i1:53-1138(+)